MKAKFKLVTLENFYDSWTRAEARDFFVKTITLKLKGYLHEYADGVLPIDTTDYVGTHHVVCRVAKGEYVPVMAYKSVSLEACLRHALHFPPLAAIGTPGRSETREDTRDAIRSMIARCEARGAQLTYDSSWTIDPEVRKDREAVKELRDILLTAHLFHTSQRSPFVSMTCGIYRFKTEQFFAGWGYRPLELPSGKSPDFSHAFLKDEKAVMIFADSYSDQAWATAKANEKVWRERVVIGREPARGAAAVKKAA